MHWIIIIDVGRGLDDATWNGRSTERCLDGIIQHTTMIICIAVGW